MSQLQFHDLVRDGRETTLSEFLHAIDLMDTPHAIDINWDNLFNDAEDKTDAIPTPNDHSPNRRVTKTPERT